MKNQRGMTLMEILIVLAILGSLIAVLLPKLKSSQDKAKVGETKIRMGKVITQLNMYYQDCGKYPESLDGLVTADASCSNWGPEPYLKKTELVDAWKVEFTYSVDNGNFVLKSLGADHKEGGDGYNKDISSDDLQ
jgi:general secretion pathway protein G